MNRVVRRHAPAYPQSHGHPSRLRPTLIVIPVILCVLCVLHIVPLTHSFAAADDAVEHDSVSSFFPLHSSATQDQNETIQVKSLESVKPKMQIVVGLAFSPQDVVNATMMAANLMSMANSTLIAEEFLKLMSVAVQNAVQTTTTPSSHREARSGPLHEETTARLANFKPPPLPEDAPAESVLPEAACEPEMKTIDLSEYTFTARDPDVAVHPRCVRVPRCGGCCGPSDLMQCTPTKVTINNVVLRKWSISSGSRHRRTKAVTQELVPVEFHDACACRCRIQAKDCDSEKQEYSQERCKCVCRSRKDHRRCLANPDKVWNPSDCSCRCRAGKKCSTGLKMNSDSCACQPIHDDDFD